ncbi:MAG: hypothetical protein ACI3VS_07890 [Evtepia sp.]
MIDYLEELLEEEAAADLEGNPLTVVGYKRGRPPTGEEETDGEDDPDRLSAPSETAGQEARLLKERETAAQEVRLLEEGESGSEETRIEARGQQTGAADLMGQLNRTRWAAQLALPGQTSVTVTVPGEGSSPGNLDLLALDRAVQRDARRYDGGFPLY